MLNRRQLRIKILQSLYAFYQAGEGQIGRAEKELMHSIQKMHEMYLLLLLIFEELWRQAEARIEEGRNKRLPSAEDLNPNLRFLQNQVVLLLMNNKELKKRANELKVSWGADGELFKAIFKKLRDTEEYKAYMSENETSFDIDKAFIIKIFKKYIVNDEDLSFYFEERSIYWIDDLDLMSSMVIKTLKKFEKDSGEENELLPLFKDDDDELDFLKKLFRKTITYSEEHEQLIKAHTDNWELDRIALMDMILMQMALTEVREFNQIPVRVSLNEYIEISKYYSTPKSNAFINGILDKVIDDMKGSGKIKKVGRGLLDV